MKKILKKEVIIAFIIGVLISSGITVYATGYLASQVTYKDGKTVEQALNDLYKKIMVQNLIIKIIYKQVYLSIKIE